MHDGERFCVGHGHRYFFSERPGGSILSTIPVVGRSIRSPVTLDSRRLCLVLVVGCQRTGTNLTGLILGTHPQSVLIEEGDGAYECLRVESNAEGPLLDALSRARQKYRAPRRRFVRGSLLGLRFKLAPSVSHLVFQVPNSTYDYEGLAGRLKQSPLRVSDP